MGHHLLLHIWPLLLNLLHLLLIFLVKFCLFLQFKLFYLFVQLVFSNLDLFPYIVILFKILISVIMNIKLICEKSLPPLVTVQVFIIK